MRTTAFQPAKCAQLHTFKSSAKSERRGGGGLDWGPSCKQFPWTYGWQSFARDNGSTSQQRGEEMKIALHIHIHLTTLLQNCSQTFTFSHERITPGNKLSPEIVGCPAPFRQNLYPNPSLLHEGVPPDVWVCVKVNQIKLLSVWVQLLLLGLMCKLETFCPTNLPHPLNVAYS